MFLTPKVLEELHRLYDEGFITLVKGLPALVLVMFLAAAKNFVHYQQLSLKQFLSSFFLSCVIGWGTWFLTGSGFYCVPMTLVGNSIIRWLIKRFNEKNIDKTMDSLFDKFTK